MLSTLKYAGALRLNFFSPLFTANLLLFFDQTWLLKKEITDFLLIEIQMFRRLLKSKTFKKK